MTPPDGPQDSPRPDEPSDSGAAGHGAGAPPPASVAEEAAKLVELLSGRGWPGSSGVPPRSAAAGDAGKAEPGESRECTCGGTTPAACRVCPVCQVIAFVQQVNPETIERVADFVGFAATALRDLATAQRERQAPGRRTDQDDDTHQPGDDETGGTGAEDGA